MAASPDNFPEHPIRPNARYEFRVNGRLSQDLTLWFEDMTLTVDESVAPSQTVIRGVVRDQAALYGLIGRLRDLGLELLAVNLVEEKDDS